MNQENVCKIHSEWVDNISNLLQMQNWKNSNIMVKKREDAAEDNKIWGLLVLRAGVDVL